MELKMEFQNLMVRNGQRILLLNGLVANDVATIQVDNQGNIWFGTNGGVSKFDGSKWTTYTSANGLQVIMLLPLRMRCSGK